MVKSTLPRAFISSTDRLVLGATLLSNYMILILLGTQKVSVHNLSILRLVLLSAHFEISSASVESRSCPCVHEVRCFNSRTNVASHLLIRVIQSELPDCIRVALRLVLQLQRCSDKTCRVAHTGNCRSMEIAEIIIF